MEKYYGEHVDGVYPEVYSMLTNPEVTQFTPEDKKKVLHTVLSMYFRTPGFLNRNTRTIDSAFDIAASSVGDPQQMMSVDWGNGPVRFKREDLESVREEQKVKLKEIFLVGHLEQWHHFVDYKMPCGVAIMTVPDEVPLITCDNPVCIIDPMGAHNPENIFAVENIIELAIDPRTYVVIMPNSISNGFDGYIQRTNRDKYFAAGTNLTTEKARQQYLIAFPGDLRKHLDSQAAFSADTPENRQQVKNTEQLGLKSLELLAVIQRVGTTYNQEVANKVKEIQAMGLANGDRTMQDLIKELTLKGLL